MAVVTAVAVVAVWIGLNKQYRAPSPTRCLPCGTTLLTRLGARAEVAGSIASSRYGSELLDVAGGDVVMSLAQRMDSLFSPGVIESPALSGRDLYVSFSMRPDGSMSQLAASFKLNNRLEWHKAMSALRGREGVEVVDTAVSGHGLFLLRQRGQSEPLFMAAGGGCLFASTTPDLLLSFGQDSVTPMREDASFSTIERTVAADAPISVFINGRSLRSLPPPARSRMLKGELAKAILAMGSGSDWMVMDIGMHPDGLSADGFAVAPRPSVAMLTARETTDALNVARRVPRGVRRFERVGAGLRGLSSASFSEALGADSAGLAYRTGQSEIFRQTGVDVEALLSQVFSAEMALCSYPGPDADFLVVDTRGGTMAQATLTQAITALHGGTPPMVISEIAPGEGAVPAGVVARRADAEQVAEVSIPVYAGFAQSDELFFLPRIFGRQVPSRLFFRYEDALVLANSMDVLRRVLVDYVVGATMEGYANYAALRSHFGGECSRFVFERQSDDTSFGIICSQLTVAGRLPYVSVFAQTPLAEEHRSTRRPTWQTRLDTLLCGPIYGVENHYTHLTECLAQDREHRLCLIGADGMLLWKRPVDGPVVGPVSQIDFYGNGKLQYLFSTQQSVYVIDRLGNDVGAFPVRLPSTSVSGASAATYSDGSPMRFFVGCQGGVALFGPDGKEVDGWKPQHPEGQLQGVARHLVCGGKDFIVYRDQYSYYFTDRRGSRRLTTQPLAPGSRSEMAVAKSGRYFVTTTTDGSVISIDPSDGKLSRLALDSIGPENIARPIDASAYLVAGRRMAAVIDVTGDSPRVRTVWRTGLQSLGKVAVAGGFVALYDDKAEEVRIFSLADGREMPASPLKSCGGMALGEANGGFAVYTVGEAGEVAQTPIK